MPHIISHYAMAYDSWLYCYRLILMLATYDDEQAAIRLQAMILLAATDVAIIGEHNTIVATPIV